MHEGRAATNIYHLHPLVAGPLAMWPATFARIAAMGFSHVCLAPPFEPGASGDIFIHATFDKLHKALAFNGSADQGIALAADFAARAGLSLMLDIAPAHIAVDSPLHQHHANWFSSADGDGVADPRRLPRQLDVAIPRFGQTDLAEAGADWWSQLLARLTRNGVSGFRCLTLNQVPAVFWRRLIASCPQALFLAWTPGVAKPRDFVGVGFDLTCTSAGWWNGRAPWFLDEHAVLRDVAPVLASPEPSFLDRLVQHLSPDVDIASAYRLALRVAAATGSGLFLPMGFEYAADRRYDGARASPADIEVAQQEASIDLSDDVTAAIAMNVELPAVDRIRRVTSPANAVDRADAV